MSQKSIFMTLFLIGTVLLPACQSKYGVKRISAERWFQESERSALDSSHLSPASSMTVQQRDLAEEHRKDPEAVIAKLYSELRDTRMRPLAAALAELCYQQAKRERNDARATRLYMTTALFAYAYLFDDQLQPAGSPYDERFHLACSLYNHSLAKGLLHIRKGGTRWGEAARQDTLIGPLEFSYGRNELAWADMGSFKEALSCYSFSVRGLNDHLRTSGLGVPLILVRDAPPREKWSAQDRFLPRDKLQAFSVTALLQLKGSIVDALAPGAAHAALIECFDPTQTRNLTIRGQQVPLETDTTTPLAYIMQKAPQLSGIEGLLDVPAWKDRRGLYMLTPYQKGKIPVVFIHGLVSSPVTWLPMVNDLLGDPQICEHFQIWYFMYPTGNPVLYNAATLRESLRDARNVFNSDGSDPAFDNMVFVGHSMGGLLSRLSVVDSGDSLWASMFVASFDELELEKDQESLLHELFFIKPLPFLTRVVFIAVPHRGSKLADIGLARFFSSLIRLSDQLVRALPVARKLMKPEYRDQDHTSITALSPENPLLKILDDLTIHPQVRYHSIIADERGAGLTGGSDTVVPYESSHLAGAESELVIKGTHTCTDHPLAIREVRRILLKHAAEYNSQAAAQGARP